MVPMRKSGKLGDYTLTAEQVASGHWPEALNNHPCIGALQFSRQWLNGQDTFTLHTSGSTGIPKSITLTRYQMEQSAGRSISTLGWPLQAELLVCINTAYIGGMMMLARGMLLNSHIRIEPPDREPDLGKGAYAVSLVPMQMRQLLEHQPAALIKFKDILLGGGPVDAYIVEQLQGLPCKVFHTYGMTETCSHIALQLLNTPQRQSHFHPLEGTELDTDERGCLAIRSVVTNNEWVQTNDLAEFHSNGGFTITGRYDDVINSGGIKIHPLESEQRAQQFLISQGFAPGTLIMATGIPDGLLGQSLALFVASPPDEQMENQLKDWLKENLPPYRAPKNSTVRFYYPGERKW